MIKPKHSFREKDFTVTEEFIDRCEAKTLYREKLNHNDKDYNILVYYGVGGIGKTKLRRELCRIHKEENPESITFYLDLNAADDRNLGAGILKLVDSCSKKNDFKCFEMAYGLYFRKKHPSALYGREKELITENTFIGIGLNILGIFDNGLTATTAEIIERSIRAIANRTIDKDVQEELKHFDEYSIAEMEERLPLFFQYDLSSYISNHPNTKILMVFDTFEALNENVIEQVHRQRNERWVQEIIEYFDRESFPHLLTLIFGRDELEWGEDWNPIIEQYQLKEFDEEYSKQYLLEAGISDSKISELIAKSSKGYPLLLYLSAETYINILNSGRKPTETDFGGNYPEIIERFLYNLDKDTVEVLRLMSIPNYYNTEIFDLLIKSFNISFPITEYEQFNKYSFVNYDKKEEEYCIHNLIRQSISEKSSETVLQKAHLILLKYFSSKITSIVNTKQIIQLFYHARKALDLYEFDKWLKTCINESLTVSPLGIIKKMQERGEQSVLLQILNGIRTEYSLGELCIELVNVYIDIVHLGGDYQLAVHICDEYLSNYSTEAILSDKQLLKMSIRKIHHSMFFDPVDQLIEDANILVEKVDKKSFPEEYNELLFLLGGNLGVLSGNFENASKWLAKSIQFAENNNLETFKQRTVRKLADISLYKNDYATALDLVNSAVNKYSTINDIDSRYKIYLMAVLGEIYRKQDDLITAWNCYDIVDKKCSENYMPGWQAHSYLAKGMVRLQENNYEDADTLFSRAQIIYKKINQKWGILTVKEAYILLQKYRNGAILKSEIDECIVFSQRMHYQYNEQYAYKLVNEDKPYLQLFFL